MNLIVEIGNTAVKASLAQGITLGKTFRYQGEKRIDYLISLIEKETPDFTVVSSSYELPQSDIRRIRSLGCRFVVLDKGNRDVLKHFGIPSYLPYDRAASVVAARNLFPGKPCTIFDFGTTLSVDFINEKGEYAGGNVSLGLRTRLKAINRYSRSLPLLGIPERNSGIGDSVESSVEYGAVSGIMFEIQGYLSLYPDNVTVFTGGDTFYFANRTKSSIFAICNLVLMGLAIIADEYVSKNIQ